MKDGSGAGAVLLTNGSGCGIREAQKNTDPDPQHWGKNYNGLEATGTEAEKLT
jgi:hypothetical protein